MTSRLILKTGAVVLCLGGMTMIGGCTREESKAQAAPAPSASHTEVSKAAAAIIPSQSDDADITANGSSALGVETFMRSSDPAKKSVTVKGVVSSVATHKQLLGLIDSHEAQECDDLSCAELTLPVKWNGKMPTPGQTVRVTGRVEDQTGGKVFFARALVLARDQTP